MAGSQELDSSVLFPSILLSVDAWPWLFLLCSILKFCYSHADKNAELCSYLPAGNGFFVISLSFHCWFLTFIYLAIYFLSPSVSGRTSGKEKNPSWNYIFYCEVCLYTEKQTKTQKAFLKACVPLVVCARVKVRTGAVLRTVIPVVYAQL